MPTVFEKLNEQGVIADTLPEEDGITPAHEDDLLVEEAEITGEAPEPLDEEPEAIEEITEIPTPDERSINETLMEDLEELLDEFPELSDLRDASELSDPIRYGKLRDLGLSPKEAYLATSGRKRVIDTRAHLSGTKPRPLNTSSKIPGYAVRCIRDLFDGISDEEIIKLYKKVNG